MGSGLGPHVPADFGNDVIKAAAGDALAVCRTCETDKQSQFIADGDLPANRNPISESKQGRIWERGAFLLGAALGFDPNAFVWRRSPVCLLRQSGRGADVALRRADKSPRADKFDHARVMHKRRMNKLFGQASGSAR